MDLAKRFEQNPILRPRDVPPSRDGLVVECVLNPGAFHFNGHTGLLLRVAERAAPRTGFVTFPVLNDAGDIEVLEFADDGSLDLSDPRAVRRGKGVYLTTLSHLRLAWSDDGVNFAVEEHPAIAGQGALERYGVEDCRVIETDGVFQLTYTKVSPDGYGVGLISTPDWRQFTRHGMILPPPNKDCALFPERVNGDFFALHRPSTVGLGGSFIWLARSPDLIHWGAHECLIRSRPGMWDSARVGAGAAPIRTPRGWLEIYHGADEENRYCLGALLLDLDNPGKVLARSRDPIMEPLADYERTGFFGNVIFTNGHTLDGDELTLYYGASDEVICGARLSISAVLASLEG
jgi:beta-1,2-mannobiose phosphorylase / 1,2-beta-oligomannan phosphorylase